MGQGRDEARRCRVESGLVWFGLLCSHFSFFHAYYVCFVEIISFFFFWSKCCQTGFSTLMQSTVQSLLPLLLLLARFLQLIMQLKPASESKSAAQIGLFYPCSSRSHASSILALPRLSVCPPLFLSAFPAAGAVIQVNAAFIHISKRIIPDVLLQNISKIMLIPFRRVQVICPEDLPTRSPHVLALAQAH